MEAAVSVDVEHCWRRLHDLADRAQTDPREAAAGIARSLAAHSNDSDRDGLRDMLTAELAGQNGAQVPAADLQRHSVWLTVLKAALAGLRR